MSRDDIHDLMLGAVVVVLGYALYKHFKQPAAPAPSPATIAIGEAAGNANTSGPNSPFTTLQDLLTGTVHDIGGFGGTNYLAIMEEQPITRYW
jgi:hypothetical protein